MTDPLSAGLAVRAASRLANSARPDAPVVDDPIAAPMAAAPIAGDSPPHPSRHVLRRQLVRRRAIRRYTANGLRRLADRLEPAIH